MSDVERIFPLSENEHAVEAAAKFLYCGDGPDLWNFISSPGVRNDFRAQARAVLRAAEAGVVASLPNSGGAA